MGDRVTFDSTIYCGQCPYCLRGEVNLCDNRQVLGVSCGDYSRQGAFAEYVSVPARVLCRIPDNITYQQAAMVEPVSVAVHGIDRAHIGPGDRVAIIGTGMIGLLALQVANAARPDELIAVDIDPRKRQAALDLGATQALESADGLDLDAAIEAVGITATVSMAIKSVRKGGRVALIGNLEPTVQIPLQVLVTREISLYGCCASQGDYEESLSLISSGEVKVDSMISETITLEQAPEYFERLHSGKSGLMKVIVCP